MQGTTLPQRPKRALLVSAALFFVAYLLFLLIWIPVKDYYGEAVTFIASKAAAGVKDLRFETMTREKDTIEASFSPLGRASDMVIGIPVKTSSYTFNAPLTFAIAAALWMWLRRRVRAFAEAAAILLAVHFLYVFSLEVKQLTDVFIERGLESSQTVGVVLYQFLWSFTDNMVIRFEPFLIGFYMYVRFRR